MALVRTSRAAMIAAIGEPLEAGCGASPLGAVWPCGCFAIPAALPAVDWLACSEHAAAAAALDGERLSGLWESPLRM
jgi:hypothetical protein